MILQQMLEVLKKDTKGEIADFKNFESWLFDLQVYRRNGHPISTIKNCFNLQKSLIPKPSEHISTYELKGKTLTYIEKSSYDFNKILKKLKKYNLQYFVLKHQNTIYLIGLDAPFETWSDALMIEKDFSSNAYLVEEISESNEKNISTTYLKRLVSCFPETLSSYGIIGIYPIIAKIEEQ